MLPNPSGLPAPSSATISPSSTTARRCPRAHAASAATISGNCSVLSLPSRDAIATVPAFAPFAGGVTVTSARMPSYFGS